MATGKKYSPLIRTTTGVLGVLGLMGIGFNAVQDSDLQLDITFFLLLFAKLFACYIFFYVALFGTNPLEFLTAKDGDS